jgi:uncharacterized membrane protein
MSNLVVVGFEKDRFRAAEALNKMRQLDFSWTGQLDDAVAVHRGYGGELIVDQSYELATGQGAGWGAIWGSMIGLVSGIFTGGATLPAAAAVAAAATAVGASVGATIGGIGTRWWKDEFGVSDDFIRRASDLLQPGDSAIFAMLTGVPDNFQKVFEDFGGKVLMTSLSDEQKEKIEKVLNHARGSK